MILPSVWHGLSSHGEHSVKSSAGDIIYATPCADYHCLYATNVWAKEETTTYYDYFYMIVSLLLALQSKYLNSYLLGM